MPIYSSDSDDQPGAPIKLFGNRRPLRNILGEGIVADILLWENKKISGAILIAATLGWFLLQVVEYNFVSLLCYAIMTLMFVLFLLSNVAPIVQREPPRMDQFQPSEDTFRYLLGNINWFLSKSFQISRGSDWRLFFGAVGILWMISVVGNYVSSLNLLYLGFVCMGTIPALYERYEREVDYIAGKGSHDARKLYKKFDSKVLNKIPRGPIKQKRIY